MANILPNTDAGLITAENSLLVFIDHQPQMSFGVASGIDRQLLVNNVLLLAKGAKEFGVPVILTTVETESFSGANVAAAARCLPQSAADRADGNELMGYARVPRCDQGYREEKRTAFGTVDGSLHHLADAKHAGRGL